ncbi:MAG: cbb3-type cytochrome c oxidase subunit 3 [Acidobacteriota bacterium]|nr:MAG: cbb3-type cytochrome c oxidase subunit 3 [Acidobacteriota bacterium]
MLPMTGPMPHLDVALLKMIALVFFFCVFLYIVIWLIFSRSERHKRHARLPLEDERVIEPRNTADTPAPADKGGRNDG